MPKTLLLVVPTPCLHLTPLFMVPTLCLCQRHLPFTYPQDPFASGTNLLLMHKTPLLMVPTPCLYGGPVRKLGSHRAKKSCALGWFADGANRLLMANPYLLMVFASRLCLRPHCLWCQHLAYAQDPIACGANPLLLPKTPSLVMSGPCLCTRFVCLWCQVLAYAQEPPFLLVPAPCLCPIPLGCIAHLCLELGTSYLVVSTQVGWSKGCTSRCNFSGSDFAHLVCGVHSHICSFYLVACKGTSSVM